MAFQVRTIIDREKCTGCGSCVKVCPERTLSLVDGRAQVTGESSMLCDQCAAVCPEGAIRVSAIDPETMKLSSLAEGDPNQVAPADLVALMRMRRSCRNYKKTPPSRELIQDLIRIGTSAPSGTNSQTWSFTVLPERDGVMRLGQEVAGFFRLLNRVAANPLARLLSKGTPGDMLGFYQREYAQTVAEALDEWDAGGEERLFHGAPAVILVGTLPGASCPKEDALLATAQILLAAQSLGLGTCLVGFAVEALKMDPRIKKKLGIPKKEKIHAAIALGQPKVHYARPAGRKKAPIRFL